ncbi:hypothetical protein LSH36_61g10036 [Paralvinella palmiformis]|uniref:FHA domain-containing protein n=1 Tax=Paralvinella palmiformis TaxID=53620 RepID=A0AAD9K5Z3_9ANNE|nr:hypothetical protein LSH36_61g10036 [Paralvinella palmiformis]
MFHLRHIGPDSQSDSLMCLKKTITIIGRKRDEVDHVICSHNYKMNAIVSRRHCRVKLINNVIEIIDDSRNGVFINDVKIDGRVIIAEGDVVTMGHPSGEKLPPGKRARQPNSEYQYIVSWLFGQSGCDVDILCISQPCFGQRDNGSYHHLLWSTCLTQYQLMNGAVALPDGPSGSDVSLAEHITAPLWSTSMLSFQLFFDNGDTVFVLLLEITTLYHLTKVIVQ